MATARKSVWDVVSARENLKSGPRVAAGRRNPEALPKATELGALSPLDIFNPERNWLPRSWLFRQAQFTLLTEGRCDSQANLRRPGSQYPQLPLVLTETADFADSAVWIGSHGRQGSQHAPGPQSAVQNLDVDDLGIKSAKTVCSRAEPHRVVSDPGPRRRVL